MGHTDYTNRFGNACSIFQRHGNKEQNQKGDSFYEGNKTKTAEVGAGIHLAKVGNLECMEVGKIGGREDWG